MPTTHLGGAQFARSDWPDLADQGQRSGSASSNTRETRVRSSSMSTSSAALIVALNDLTPPKPRRASFSDCGRAADMEVAASKPRRSSISHPGDRVGNEPEVDSEGKLVERLLTGIELAGEMVGVAGNTVQVLKKENAELREENEEKNDEVSVLNGRIDASQTTINELAAQISKVKEQISSMRQVKKEKIKSSKKNALEREGKINQRDQMIATLSKTLETLEAGLRAAESEKSRLIEQKRRLTDRVKQAESSEKAAWRKVAGVEEKQRKEADATRMQLIENDAELAIAKHQARKAQAGQRKTVEDTLALSDRIHDGLNAVGAGAAGLLLAMAKKAQDDVNDVELAFRDDIADLKKQKVAAALFARAELERRQWLERSVGDLLDGIESGQVADMEQVKQRLREMQGLGRLALPDSGPSHDASAQAARGA